MSDRFNYYFQQPVKEAELDDGFDALERADRAMVVDLGLSGVASGMTVAQSSSPGISAIIAAGVAYDALGQRIYLPSQQTISLITDSNNVSTAVAGSGNAKVVSVFAQFTRNNTDPRVDGNSVPVYFNNAEAFAFVVRQGLEATLGTEQPPALESDKILLADIQRTYGQTQILTASINPTSYAPRRQDAFIGTGGSSNTRFAYRVGTMKAALQAIIAEMYPTEISPVSISGSLTDYAPANLATARVLLQNCSAAAVLRSLVAKPAGSTLEIFNTSTSTADTLTLNHMDATGGVTAAYRFYCPNLANFVIRAGGMAAVYYDANSSLWRVKSP